METVGTINHDSNDDELIENRKQHSKSDQTNKTNLAYLQQITVMHHVKRSKKEVSLIWSMCILYEEKI